MQVCPMCQGRTITAEIIDQEPDAHMTEWGLFAVVGILKDRPCGVCEGTGRVSDLHFFRLTSLDKQVR